MLVLSKVLLGRKSRKIGEDVLVLLKHLARFHCSIGADIGKTGWLLWIPIPPRDNLPFL